jgi:TRAP transporter TAXI family solute receptor
MGRRGFLGLAGLFAFSAMLALAFHIGTAPTQLKLAVGPIGSEDVRMAAAFVQAVNRDKGSIRLRLVLSDSLEESARKLDGGAVDLAIVRPDIALPVKGETLLITRRFYPFFVTGRDRGVERVADLRGRKIGVVNTPKGNIDLLKQILSFYEVGYNEVDIVGLAVNDIATAVANRDIDVMFAVGALSSRTLSPGVATTRQAWGQEPVFITIREADALAARNRAIETGEIVRGSFGGDPPRPAEPLPSISVTHRLMGASTLSESAASELTRLILTQRTQLTNEVPAIQGVEAPQTNKDAALPVHAGAAAYLDGTERTFFDRYGDWFYLGVMAVSLLGSAAAALLSQASGARRRTAMQDLPRVVGMIAEAREAADFATLDMLERDADAIIAQALESFAASRLDDAGLSAFRIAIDQLGRAIIERRRIITEHVIHAVT